mgnify:FL=1
MSDGKQIFCQILPQGSIINVLKGVNDMNNDLISIAKLNELFSKKIDEERKTKLLWILAIVGAVAAVVVAAHYIYKFFAPDYMDDFEDEFEDEFEDDFFDDEDDE